MPGQCHSTAWLRSPPCRIALGLFAAASWSGVAASDVVELVHGGRLVGRIADDPSRTTLTLLLQGGGRVTLDRDQVSAVRVESAAAAEYRRRAPTAPDTVASQWALARWCQKHSLKDQYRRHLRRVVELDPADAEARKLLGYRRHNGRWLTREQLMAARGMIRYEGEYRTRQEIRLLEAAQRSKEQNAQWRSRLDRWRRNLSARDPERRGEAVASIEQLRDTAAGPELAKLLLKERDVLVKRLLVKAAARVPHGACVTALSRLALDDPDEETRMLCLELLAKADTPGLAEPFIGGLRSKSNDRVNRAATALEAIGATGAVPALVDAIATRHTFTPRPTAPGEQTYTLRQGGGFTFGDNRPKPVTRDVNNPAVLSALIKLTGMNFAYDKAAWSRWLSSRGAAAPIDLRRDP